MTRQLLKFKAPAKGAESLPFAAADVVRVVNPLADAVADAVAEISQLRQELDAVKAEVAELKARERALPVQAGNASAAAASEDKATADPLADPLA